MDATLTDQFAGDAAVGVGISVAGRHGRRVGHPGRLALVGAHVRCGNVESGSDEVLASKLDGEPTSDLFDLVTLTGKRN